MHGIAIREFELADYDEVCALWQATGLELRRSDERAEVAKKLERDPDLFLVAEELASRSIVGSVMGAWDGRRGWLYHLGVLPAWQRRGLARHLLAELERRLRAKGALKVNLIVRKDNLAAQHCYEALGYRHEDAYEEMGKLLD
jgi:ribosomal protein S18 acetylase RimI-like enzyme